MNKMCSCDNQNSQTKFCSGVAPKLNTIKSGSRGKQTDLWIRDVQTTAPTFVKIRADFGQNGPRLAHKVRAWTLGPEKVYTVYTGTDTEFSILQNFMNS